MFGFPIAKQMNLPPSRDTHKGNVNDLLASDPKDSTGFHLDHSNEEWTGSPEDAIPIAFTSDSSTSDALPTDSELSDEGEQKSSMPDDDTYFSTPTTADEDFSTQTLMKNAKTGSWENAATPFDRKTHAYRPREPGPGMDAVFWSMITEPIPIRESYYTPDEVPRKAPMTQVCSDFTNTEAQIRLSPEVDQLLHHVQAGRKNSNVWSVNTLFSTKNRHADRQLGPKDLAQAELLADIFSATSLHEEAFYLSRLVVLQTLPEALEAGLNRLKARLTRLVKNATSSSDRSEVIRIRELATAKYGRLDSIDPAGCLLFSHIGYCCHADQDPYKAREMCQKTLSSMVNGWGTWGVMAELLVNRWNSLVSTIGPDEAQFLVPWDATLRLSIEAPGNHQLNDSIATLCQWIRNMLSDSDSDVLFTNQNDTLWQQAPDENAQADIESTLLFCYLWNRWQRRKDMVGIRSTLCENAFGLIQTACGLSQVELMSALARLVLEEAERGVKADLNRRALRQVYRIESEPKLRSIVALLHAHVEPLFMRARRLSNPGYNALRRESVRTFVEMNTSISETLLYDSRFRQTSQISESPFISPCITDSPRSSCSSGLRSFKGIHLRQLAKRLSKSSSLRLSQISDMSIATFSSGERWLQEHAVEPRTSLLLARSTSRMTMISAPKLISSSNALVDLYEANEASDTSKEAADVMDLDMDTSMQL